MAILASYGPVIRVVVMLIAARIVVSLSVLAIAASLAAQPAVRRSERKLPKSSWDSDASWYRFARAGDVAEYDHPDPEGLFAKSKLELIEKGDHFFVQRRTTVFRAGSGGTVQSEIKFQFTEPDPPATAKAGSTITTKKGTERVKFGERELEAEWTETYEGGKLLQKEWRSKEVPFDGTIKIVSSDGTVRTRLLSFTRGK